MSAPPLQAVARMRAWIGLVLLLGGCQGVEGRQADGVTETQTQATAPVSCVEVGGGELQAGLKLGLGGGDVTVTAVQHRGGNAIGFTVSATAPQLFFIIYIFIGDQRDALIGLGLVLLGLPAYLLFRRKK